MRILSIETSCDETSAAVVEKNENETYVKVLSNITATSLATHAKTGGIIPENASREQVKFIMPVIMGALNESRSMKNESWDNARKILTEDIDAIAVTYGPGLIGSLLVGVETAKTLSMTFDKPIVPVNHLLAHIFANFINPEETRSKIKYPFIGLIVSGGHTDLLLFRTLSDYQWLGGTLDDAAGEALDKIGRMLGLSYPAGPEIERRANLSSQRTLNQKQQIKFVSPMLNSDNFDFSFSGLKSEASRFISQLSGVSSQLSENQINQICYATQSAIIEVLVKKTVRAAKMFNCTNVLLGGGVSANSTLRTAIEQSIINHHSSIKLFVPQKAYTTDNAAMIGAYALSNFKPSPWKKIDAEPELYFD